MPTWVAAIIALIPYFLGALLMTLSFWLYFKLRLKANKLISYVGLICFWIGYEYLHQTWDLSFPWMNLGNGFAAFHQLIQWYEYTGVYGGTLWVLISNILLFEVYQALSNKEYVNSKRKKWLLAGSVATIFLPISCSLIIYYTYNEEPNPSNIVVVQPNIDPYEKFGRLSSAAQIQTSIELSKSAAQTNTEYFIWPETAITGYVQEDNFINEQNFYMLQHFLAPYKNGNLISGIESIAVYDKQKTNSARFDDRSKVYYDNFNAAIQVENSSKVQFYHKSKLVPGAEQIPFAGALSFLKPVFAGFGGASGSYGKQDKPSVFYSQSGIGAAPVICYESIWGEYVGDYVQQGAQFIAIITNDGWWGNTSGKDQHLLYAKLRAVETRRWVARSANTGISAFINQRGDIVQQTKWWVPAVLKADINLNSTLTFYTKHGDYIALIGVFGSALFALFLLSGLFIKSKKPI
ncbi:MAG: acyltransferase [Daejeonella sp.]|nr:acyltransferase [Daejeonella sp.]